MSELKTISGGEVATARSKGQYKKATTIKMDINLLKVLSDIAAGIGGYGAKIRVIETSIRNGLFYKDHLKPMVDEYMRMNKPLRDEYVKRFEERGEHTSYVDGTPVLLGDYIATAFIIDAINEKIDACDAEMRSKVPEGADSKAYGMDKRMFKSWLSKGWRQAFDVDGRGRARKRRGIYAEEDPEPGEGE